MQVSGVLVNWHAVTSEFGHKLLVMVMVMVLSDLRPAFHWNLQQLFVFVLAEYETKNNVSFSLILYY
jgi:hypothetical protein